MSSNETLASNTTSGPDNLVSNKPKKKQFDKSSEKYFLMIIFVFVCLVYYVYAYQFIWLNLSPKNNVLSVVQLTIFNFLLILVFWSHKVTMFTNPGEIPKYWGFHIGDDDSKRKRYCLLCNAFKPDRCHHCSICNKCILNMDHHCPWVNNCIGFYNRKFFLQLVFYVVLCTWFVNLTMAHEIYLILSKIYFGLLPKKEMSIKGLILSVYTVNFTLSVLISMFFKFHFNLLVIKSTTIEILDKNHEEINKKYNHGFKQNWYDIFGESKLCWILPLRWEQGRPLGDGLLWPLPMDLHSSNVLSTSSSNVGLCKKNKKTLSSFSGATFSAASVQQNGGDASKKTSYISKEKEIKEESCDMSYQANGNSEFLEQDKEKEKDKTKTKIREKIKTKVIDKNEESMKSNSITVAEKYEISNTSKDTPEEDTKEEPVKIMKKTSSNLSNGIKKASVKQETKETKQESSTKVTSSVKTMKTDDYMSTNFSTAGSRGSDNVNTEQRKDQKKSTGSGKTKSKIENTTTSSNKALQQVQTKKISKIGPLK